MKGGAALVQIKNAKSVADALRTLLDAARISNEDKSKLTALVQQQQQSMDSDSELGAPDPAAYENQSGGIVDALNKLLEDAETQLSDARKTESKLQHNYDMLKQDLTDKIKFGTREMDKAKKDKAANEETKATAEGDLAVTMKALGEDMTQLNQVHHDCMTKASDFEIMTQGRAEELKAIATAKK